MSKRRLIGTATEDVRAREWVIVRHGMVTPANEAIATGRAASRPPGLEPVYRKGTMVGVEPRTDQGTSLDLQAIADGPIMRPLAIYLPAGRCSEAEMKRRERLK